MEYKDPNGDFKAVLKQIKCPKCGWESSIKDLDPKIKIRCCDLCGHEIHL